MTRRALLCLVLPVFCACYSAKQGKELQSQVEQLQKQVKELESSSTAERERLTTAVSTAEQEVSDLEDLLKKVDKLTKGDFAQLGTDLDTQKKEVSEIKVNLEELQQKLEELSTSQTKLNDEVGRIAGAVDKPTPATPPAAALPTDPKELFAYGESKMHEEAYTDARKAFREYLKANAKGDKAEDAQFYLGEAYYNEKKYDDATREYSKLLEAFPDGDRADDALFRLGLSAVQTGDCDSAEIYLTELTTKHKKSPFYKDASKQLKDLPAVKKAGKCTKK